jgi:hypothetical protein
MTRIAGAASLIAKGNAMKNRTELEVVSVDCYAGDAFVLYFSDNTYTSITARDLAERFPDRLEIPKDDQTSTVVSAGQSARHGLQ